MSVINKMLRDLDKRGGLGPRNLEENMKEIERVPVAADEPRPWGRIVAVAALVVVAGAVAVWYALKPAERPQLAIAPVTPTPPKREPVVLPPSQAPAQPAPVATAPSPPPTPPVATPAPASTPAPAPVAVAPPPETKVAAVTPAPEPKPQPKKAAPGALLEMPAIASSAVKAQQDAVKAREAAIEATPLRARPEPPPAKVAVATPPVEKEAALPSPPPSPKGEGDSTPRPSPKAEVQAAAPPGRIALDRGERVVSGSARAAAEYRNGNEQLNRGQVPAALAAYAEALRHDARHVPARQAMIVLLLDQGRPAEAQAALREGIEAVPQNLSWPMLLARLQVEGGDAKGALETLERSAPQAGGQAEYHGFLATLLQMQSRHADAIRQYEASLRVAPDSGRWLTGLGISLEAEKRVPEAREAYRRALASGNLGRDLEAFTERRLKQLQ